MSKIKVMLPSENSYLILALLQMTIADRISELFKWNSLTQEDTWPKYKKFANCILHINLIFKVTSAISDFVKTQYLQGPLQCPFTGDQAPEWSCACDLK